MTNYNTDVFYRSGDTSPFNLFHLESHSKIKRIVIMMYFPSSYYTDTHVGEIVASVDGIYFDHKYNRSYVYDEIENVSRVAVPYVGKINGSLTAVVEDVDGSYPINRLNYKFVRAEGYENNSSLNNPEFIIWVTYEK